MKDKEKIVILINRVKKYKLSTYGCFAALVFCAIVFSLLMTVSNNAVNNEKVLYCELANKNAEVANEMIPYFGMYMDDSIETIGNINKTAAKLLELRLPLFFSQISHLIPLSNQRLISIIAFL